MRELKEFLRKCLKEISFIEEIEKISSEDKIDKFIFYLQELKRWNKAYSLTSIEDEREIIVKHFIDSLFYLSFISQKAVVADVGSGAGFPGVPLAIANPELTVILIEPSWKKVAFLKNLKIKLKLNNIEILQAKAEEIHRKFDIVVSRALWSIKDFVENCSHLVKEEGFFLVSKSKKIEEELKDLPPELKIEIKEFRLPFFNGQRYIVKIKK